MPGRRTSLAKIGLPRTFSGVSSRDTDVPISRHFEGGLSGTLAGTGRLDAPCASSPYRSVLPVPVCRTTLSRALHSAASMPQRAAASEISIIRARAGLAQIALRPADGDTGRRDHVA